MRILSTFSDYYDKAAAARHDAVVYRRQKLSDEPYVVESKLAFPKLIPGICARHSLTVEFLLIAGALWPIIHSGGKTPSPIHRLPVAEKNPLAEKLQPWERAELSPVHSAEASALQRQIGHPLARIAATQGSGFIMVYDEAPRLVDYGVDLAELPERIAGHIKQWLIQNTQETLPVNVNPKPRRQR